MPIRNTTTRWGSLGQLFHWVIVALIITQFVLATISVNLPLGMAKLAMLARHKSVGITILGLAGLRLLWRWMNPTPELPNTLKPYERVLASFTHFALYLLLFVMPLTGWAMSSARKYPVSWFSLVQLPDFVAPNRELYETLHTTHAVLAWTLAGVAVLHAAAAFKHHFVLKDDVLRRMLPFTKTRSGG
jgi:cytochrome b561